METPELKFDCSVSLDYKLNDGYWEISLLLNTPSNKHKYSAGRISPNASVQEVLDVCKRLIRAMESQFQIPEVETYLKKSEEYLMELDKK